MPTHVLLLVPLCLACSHLLVLWVSPWLTSPESALGRGDARTFFPHQTSFDDLYLCSFKSKKGVAETPSAIFHYSENSRDETGPCGKTDAIFRAATKDLLTLMKLDVSLWAQKGVVTTSDPHTTCFFLSPILGSTSFQCFLGYL